MHTEALTKVVVLANKKISFMQKSPFAYLLLAALAGVYIGMGDMLMFSIGGPLEIAGDHYATIIMSLSFGGALCLVIFAGAELFTGNMMVFSVGRLSKHVGVKPIINLFGLCYAGNFIGCAFLAWMVTHGGSLPEASQDLILKVSAMKMSLPPEELFIRAVMCNWLVCLAVWIAYRTQNEAAKLILIFWCIFAFLGSGFEHSIANQALLSMALFLPHGPEVSIAGLFYNQFWVVFGNLVGGGIMVGTVYWFASPGTSEDEKINQPKIKQYFQEGSREQNRLAGRV